MASDKCVMGELPEPEVHGNSFYERETLHECFLHGWPEPRSPVLDLQFSFRGTVLSLRGQSFIGLPLQMMPDKQNIPSTLELNGVIFLHISNTDVMCGSLLLGSRKTKT